MILICIIILLIQGASQCNSLSTLPGLADAQFIEGDVETWCRAAFRYWDCLFQSGVLLVHFRDLSPAISV